MGVDPQFLRASRQELEKGAQESGKSLKEKGFRVVCWTPCSILDDGRAARSAVKAHVARILKRKLPFELDGPTMDVVNKIRQQYEYYEHMVVGTAHGEVVSDELVERFAIDKGAISRQLQHLDDLGLVVRTPDPDDGRATLVAASDDARRRLADVAEHRRKWLDEQLGDWTADELETFATMLERYNLSLNA